MKPIRILMIGGHNCGKTSALCCMFEQAINNPVGEYFTISDQTPIERNIYPISDTITGKSLELRQVMSRSPSKFFLVDRAGGHFFRRYTFSIQERNSSKSLSLEFLDVPGSFLELGSCHYTEINEEIEKCKVIIVCIDTPYLMGPVEEENKELCTEAINLGVNRIDDIHGFLTNINDNNGNDAKMVVFVPLKCEKWAKEGRIYEVTDRVKKVYHKTIQALSAYKKMTVGIISIETAGNILFSEFKEAYTVTDKIGRTKRCCYISESTLRLEDGTLKKIKDTDYICQDPSACLFDCDLLRPYSWFHVNAEDSSYSPKNGDQLLIHILIFIVNIKRDKQNSITRFFYLPEDITWLENLLSRLNARNIIVNNGDGFEYLKRYY